MSMLDEREVGQALRSMTLVWGAHLAAVPIYLFVLPRYIPAGLFASLPPQSLGAIRAALYALSLVAILLASFLPRRIISRKPGWPQKGSFSRHPAVQRYSTATIVALALSEFVAIAGLMLFLMSRDAKSLYFLGLVSFLSMLMHRPSRQGLLDTARNLATSSSVREARP